MAFQQEPVRSPASIGTIVVTLKDGINRYDQPYQTADFDVKVYLSDGSIVGRHGDLVPHITAAQRQALVSFMAALRSQAESQILPP
jgi:hypothetical protein